MKFNIFIFITMFNFLFSNNISGYELAELLDQKKQPLSSKTEIVMTLINLKKDRSKLKEMVSITKDDGNKMLLFFKSPKRDKGVGFLKIEDSNKDKLSLFIPKLKKIRRISSSNQSDSFMGSDLSFEDMTSRDIDDYKYKIVSEDTPCFEEDKSQKCFILESIPNDKKSEYSKHLSWVDKKNYIWHKEESYDKSGNLLKDKRIKYSLIDNFYIMNELQVENVQKKHSTLLTVSDIKINLNFSDDIFHTKTIKRMPLID